MNETSVAEGLSATRIAALAAKLDASPREVLALAARRAQGDADQRDGTSIDAELAQIRASGAAGNAIGILLLGYSSFALDDLDRALGLVWAGVDVGSP